jgi:signal transduction histidine kinase/ligand-binding sensor domain-containing protein
MSLSSQVASALALLVCATAFPTPLRALDPHKALTQYTRALWTQADGLPQDSIRSIAQTSDGYLWLGTDDGLARFDGYEFVIFNKNKGFLPSNSIETLSGGRDNTLWIGTSNGLVRYRNGQFQTFTTADGLADNFILSLFEDDDGVLWIACGVYLNRFEHGKFFKYPPEHLLPVKTPRRISRDRHHSLLITGIGGLVRKVGDRFEPVLKLDEGAGQVVALTGDRSDNVWIGGRGLIRRTAEGLVTTFGPGDGLPGELVRAVIEDRDGNIWTGTTEGLARLENGHFVIQAVDGKRSGNWVRCMFEDREGNLWVGMNGGLYRFRDDLFTNYGRTEGFPADEPIAVHEDRSGRVWVGYHSDGVVAFQDGKLRSYTTRDGLASNEIFAIRETRVGDLLILGRGGVSLLRNGRASTFIGREALGIGNVYDILEDRGGRLWAAAGGGVYRVEDHKLRSAVPVIPGGPFRNDSADVLAEGPDGSIWAGTYGEGLWRISDSGVRRFTTADGLSSDRIRSLLQDADGTLWIGTFGGGLSALRNGVFSHYTEREGLLSDNVSHIDDDGTSLWLATTRGVCQVHKQQLDDLAAHRIRVLTPVNYTAAEGLRSAQCAPGYPIGAGGTRSHDGRIWFPTTRGLASIDPQAAAQRKAQTPPAVHFISASVDGQELNLSRDLRLGAGSGRIQFRFAAIHLTAPERVRYEYKLEGLDSDWSAESDRRVISYNTLGHGRYRFRVRGFVPGHDPDEASLAFQILPHFYERGSFLMLCAVSLLAAIYGLYQLRLRQIRGRFSLVLEERTRIAREIHDTLAQGFVGLSSQLDAVAVEMGEHQSEAWQRLETARKMARHNLTEAKRSVMDLRASAPKMLDLGPAVIAATSRWQSSGSVPIDISISGESRDLPEDIQQNMLRIAQEAVANAIKHARATGIWIHLVIQSDALQLSVRDDGKGFPLGSALSAHDGHFGLVGMIERAERVGGKLDIRSDEGAGTLVAVTVPLPRRKSRNGIWQNLRGLLKTPAAHSRL